MYSLTTAALMGLMCLGEVALAPKVETTVPLSLPLLKQLVALGDDSLAAQGAALEIVLNAVVEDEDGNQTLIRGENGLNNPVTATVDFKIGVTGLDGYSYDLKGDANRATISLSSGIDISTPEAVTGLPMQTDPAPTFKIGVDGFNWHTVVVLREDATTPEGELFPTAQMRLFYALGPSGPFGEGVVPMAMREWSAAQGDIDPVQAQTWLSAWPVGFNLGQQDIKLLRSINDAVNWSDVMLPQDGLGDGDESHPSIATNSAGTAMIVAETDSALDGTGGDDKDLVWWYSIDGGANWSLPKLLQEGADTDGTNEVEPQAEQFNWDGKDVFWVGYTNTGALFDPAGKVYYTYAIAGAEQWSEPQQLNILSESEGWVPSWLRVVKTTDSQNGDTLMIHGWIETRENQKGTPPETRLTVAIVRIPPPPAEFECTCTLSGDNIDPPTGSSVTGGYTGHIFRDTNSFNYFANFTPLEATDIQIRRGTVGEEGELLRSFGPNSNILIGLSIGGAPHAFDDLLAPPTYMVVKTAAFPNGELFGHITCSAVVEGEGEGGGEGAGDAAHTADQDGSFTISVTELLRVIQFYNAGALYCAENPGDTEDGYEPGTGTNQDCTPHDSDYSPQDWSISLSELLRLIQVYNVGSYSACPSGGTEDGFCLPV